MKILHLAALAALTLTAAQAPACAEDLTITYAPYYKFGSTSAKIIHVPQPGTDAERAAFAEQDSKWIAYCQPVRTIDDEGMIRLQYARKGCEQGRSE